MSAAATTHAHVGSTATARLLDEAGFGLLCVRTDDMMANAILRAVEGRGIPLGKVTTDYDSVRVELGALIHARIADRCDPAHLAAVEAQSRALRARLGRRS